MSSLSQKSSFLSLIMKSNSEYFTVFLEDPSFKFYIKILPILSLKLNAQHISVYSFNTVHWKHLPQIFEKLPWKNLSCGPILVSCISGKSGAGIWSKNLLKHDVNMSTFLWKDICISFDKVHICFAASFDIFSDGS